MKLKSITMILEILLFIVGLAVFIMILMKIKLLRNYNLKFD